MELPATETSPPLKEPVQPPVAASSLYEQNKLRIAGALNALGDVSLLYGAYKEKNPLRILAGILYTAGAAAITFFGSTSKEEQVKDLTERAAEFIQARSGEKSPELESTQIMNARNTGFFAELGKSLRRHAGQVMLWFYTLGAGAMLANGIVKLNKHREETPKDKHSFNDFSGVFLGGFSLLIKGVSLMMPERTQETSEEAKSKGEKGIVAWVKEKPMRLFGYGSLLTEGFWAWDTYADYKKGNEWRWNATTTASYMLSDVVIANTNKDAANAVGKLNDAEQAKLENMMAETIAVQPEEQREKLSGESAIFLKKEAIVNGSVEQLRESILKRATKLWSERNNTPAQAEPQRA